ncbi:MAG: phosphodiester glycosidase family protein [Oscillospiraceae bacterium]|nr:phosphodiester glycosidase family protein [Oscillospiraceae bacterium]
MKTGSENKQLPLGVLVLQQLLLAGFVLCVFLLCHLVLPGLLPRQAAVPLPEKAAPVPTAAPETPTETAASPAADPGALPDRPGIFTAEILRDETHYSSPDLRVTVTAYEHTEAFPTLTYYAADIYVHTLDVILTADPPDSQYLATPLAIARDVGAVLAINGDSNSHHDGVFLVRNGQLLRNDRTDSDICVLYRDGRMVTYGPGEYTAEAVLAEEPAQVWCFGPALLDGEGRPLDRFNIENSLQASHPRTVLGYFEPGHYCFVVIDGRRPWHSMGADMATTARVMSSLGCKAAYNLDGGASSVMIFADKTVNLPSWDRKLSEAIVLRERPEVQP